MRIFAPTKRRRLRVSEKAAYKLYLKVAEGALTTFYQEIGNEFYSFINHDKKDFKAMFEPSEGKLGLLVDFQEKLMFALGALITSFGTCARCQPRGLRSRFGPWHISPSSRLTGRPLTAPGESVRV